MTNQSSESATQENSETQLREIAIRLNEKLEDLAHQNEEIKQLHRRLQILTGRQHVLERIAQRKDGAGPVNPVRPTPGTTGHPRMVRPGMQQNHAAMGDRILHQAQSPFVPNQRPQSIVPVPIDVLENKREFTVVVDLAGFKKDDISLNFSNSALHLRAMRTSEQKDTIESDETGQYILRERRPMAVRSIPIPSAIDQDNIHATMAEGVLVVTLAKDSTEESEQGIKIE